MLLKPINNLNLVSKLEWDNHDINNGKYFCTMILVVKHDNIPQNPQKRI